MVRRRAGLIVVGLVALGVAWMFATPQWQAPDEGAQYLRALTISQGHLLGPRVPIDPAGTAALAAGSWHAQEERWILHDRRGVQVTAALSPPGTACVNGQPDTSSCQEASYTGDYFPPGYLLPAVAMHGQHTAGGALWTARAASLAQTLAFLLLAVLLTGSGTALLGLAVAISPAALFIGAAMNPSGLEIAASLAFLAGLLRWARDPAGIPAWARLATVVSGVVAIVSWQLGPVFAACGVAVAAVLLSSRPSRAALRRHGGWVAATALLLVAAVVAFVIYGRHSGALHSSISFAHPGADLRAGWNQLGQTMRGAVGRFGAYDIPLPEAIADLWLAVAAGLWLLGLAVGDRRERLALILAAGLGVAVPVLFYAFAQKNSGFGLQGRYALPVFAIVPVLSGSVLERHQGQRVARVAATASPLVWVLLAALQLVAWWFDARHWAGSTFFTHAAVTPPGGWWPWAACAIVGAVALAAQAVSRTILPNLEPAEKRS
jgi:hypothetical protein